MVVALATRGCILAGLANERALDGSPKDWDFDDLPRPSLRILLIFVTLLAAVILALLTLVPLDELETLTDFSSIAVLGFLVNLIVFVSFWAVYFLSPHGIMRCQSLRTLLRSHTREWTGAEVEQSARSDRASASLTAQAVFIAVSVLIINMIADQNIKYDVSVFSVSRGEQLERVMALCSLASATVSFALLLISFDVTDTTFNSFKKGQKETGDMFFKLAGSLKYYGFVLSYLSLVLFVFSISPLLAALAAAAFLCFGYSYWFPSLRTTALRREAWAFRAIVLLGNLGFLIYAF